MGFWALGRRLGRQCPSVCHIVKRINGLQSSSQLKTVKPLRVNCSLRFFCQEGYWLKNSQRRSAHQMSVFSLTIYHLQCMCNLSFYLCLYRSNTFLLTKYLSFTIHLISIYHPCSSLTFTKHPPFIAISNPSCHASMHPCIHLTIHMSI